MTRRHSLARRLSAGERVKETAIIDVKKRFYVFYFGHVFYVFNVFLFSKRFFILKKTLTKFRAASRLTRSTFKITATKRTYDFSKTINSTILKISLLA